MYFVLVKFNVNLFAQSHAVIYLRKFNVNMMNQTVKVFATYSE